MENKQYTITLSDYMKKYQSDNDIKTKIESIELVDKKQLKNKRPKFIIKQIFCFGTGNERCFSSTIPCSRREDKFVVPRGWGQLTGAVIERNLNHKKNLSVGELKYHDKWKNRKNYGKSN